MTKEILKEKAISKIKSKWSHLFINDQIINKDNLPINFVNDLKIAEYEILSDYFFKNQNDLITKQETFFLKQIYMLGFEHELKDPSIKLSPNLIIKFYNHGKSDALLGDDSADHLFNFESHFK